MECGRATKDATDEIQIEKRQYDVIAVALRIYVRL